MATTWSFKLLALTSMGRRTDRVSLRMCWGMVSILAGSNKSPHPLEFQPRFPGRSGQGFHTAVIHVTASIEDNLLDPGGAGALGNLFPNQLCRREIASSLELLASFLVDRAGRDQRATGAVLDHLSVDMPVRAIHGKMGTVRRAGHARAHALMNSPAMRVARKLSDWFRCHDILLDCYGPGLGAGAAFPAFFFKGSPVIRMPFCLYGSGGRKLRIFAQTWPT